MTRSRALLRPAHAAYPADGGRSCSLEFTPRRWFGCRFEQVIADFLRTHDPALLSLSTIVLDLLRGAVRAEFDDCVRLQAHHSPARGTAQVNVTVYFGLPTAEPLEIDEVLGILGRLPTRTSHFRLGNERVRPASAQLVVQSQIVGQSGGETRLVTALVVCAELRSVVPGASSR